MKTLRLIFARLRQEAGLGLVEVLVGMMILAIGFFALTGAIGLGFKQVGLGRQRQTASEIANARIEHLRNSPYDRIAVRPPDPGEPGLVHNTDSENPDYWVDNGPPKTYDVNAGVAGGVESLIEADDGDVDHIEDPVSIGTTTFEIYQYATWVDDAAVAGTQNYRRVTVVVKYKVPAIGGITKTVQVSSFFTPQTVSSDGAPSSPAPGSPSPEGSPSPSPSPSGSCSGDTSPPTGSFSIQSGAGADAGFSNSRTVTLSLSFSDACTPIRVRFSNDGATYGGDHTYDATNPTVSFTLDAGDGSKSVWGKGRDGVDNEATFGPETITLDETDPTIASAVNRDAGCVGNDRTVTLHWSAASDANLKGHRVYRSVNNGEWQAIGTTGTTTTDFADTHNKTYDSVRFKVVGYDKAGNEADPTTDIVSLSRNQCS